VRARWLTGLMSVMLASVAALALPEPSSAGSAGLTAVAAGTRAMWVWGDYPADDLIGWAAGHSVSEIFVYVSPSVLTNGDLARLQELRRVADIRKIKLRALGGDPDWTGDQAAALAWQKAVVKTGLFDGIHLDVEPYLSDGWTTDLAATERAYLKLLDSLRKGSKLAVDADVPFWFGQYRIDGANLADEVLKRVSSVTVMSYRDTATGPNSMLAVSQDWLTRGAASGKRVRLGAETNPLADCGYCTFNEEGAAKMNDVLAKVDAGMRHSGAFAGIAIHRYGSWRALKQ
jgi:hypothetical protein